MSGYLFGMIYILRDAFLLLGIKMIFDVEVPKEARWIAQDSDGTWMWYTHEPIAFHCHYASGGEWGMVDSYGKVSANYGSLCVGPSPKDWTQELYELEDD